MPDFVSLEILKDWKCRFDEVLASISNDAELALLIDTGKHGFESVECLKFLRDYLTETPDFRNKFVKAAFVAPSNFAAPHIVSDMEAYFNEFQAAYDWLKSV